MKNKLKVFGERNSGTNFVRELIYKNHKQSHHKLEIIRGAYYDKLGWKHGYAPTIIDDEVLTVYIVRELNSWANSMLKKPYEIKINKSTNNKDYIYEFLNMKLEANITNKEFSDHIFHDEIKNGINLMQLRYGKYLSFKNTPNIFVVNLKYLQESYDNQKEFLSFIEANTNIIFHDEFIKIKEAASSPKKVFKQTVYPQLDFSKIKDYNLEIENEINNITYGINK